MPRDDGDAPGGHEDHHPHRHQREGARRGHDDGRDAAELRVLGTARGQMKPEEAVPDYRDAKLGLGPRGGFVYLRYECTDPTFHCPSTVFIGRKTTAEPILERFEKLGVPVLVEVCR